MAEGRWDRLAEDLRAAGFDVRLDERPYSEFYRGRPRAGVTRSITFQVMGLGLISVSDRYWAKNLDTWLGWDVTVEGTDSITIGRPVLSKKRSEVVAAVRAAHRALTASARH